MKVVFRKNKNFKYVCFNCDKQFNWIQGVSVRFGKMEYKTIQEEKETDKIFCSQKCYDKKIK